MGRRKRALARILLSLGMLALLLLVVSCSGHDPQDTLAPHGHQAAVIKGLFYPIFWIAVAIFFFVVAVLIYSLIRFRDRPGREMPVQIHGSTPLEIGWTLAPTLLLGIISIFTIATLVQINNTPKGAMQVNVIAHQWWWEFDYPEYKITTADQLHIPAGTPVRINLHSDDVVHAFWVPSLAGKTEVIPNHDNGLWLNAYQPGVYSAQCTEFCGEEHALMRFEVVSQSQADFNTWVKQQQTPPPPALDQKDAGQQAFMNGPCIACHTIDGTSAQGKIGPNLTHFGSRTWFEEMDNTPENVAKWLHDPQAIKPGNKMPNYHLSDQDIQSLVAFLESLK